MPAAPSWYCLHLCGILSSPQILKVVHDSKENSALSWRGWGEGQEGWSAAGVINEAVYDEGNEN